MFYKVFVEDHIRVSPDFFDRDLSDSVLVMIKKKYEGFISREFGFVVDVCDVSGIDDGKIIPGDGAAYYSVSFSLLSFLPEMQEVVFGKVVDIADFGAFLNIGPIDGMVHISQSMDDFVSFSKDKSLLGRDSKRSLKVGDRCKARLIVASFKNLSNPKIGLTMRNRVLGKLEWIEAVIDGKKKSGGVAK